MLFSDFLHKLKKLNKNLWVDTEHFVPTVSQDFKFGGLYDGNAHVMAVSLGNVPEYSVLAVNLNKAAAHGAYLGGATGKSGQFLDFDFVENIKKNYKNLVEEKLLARGYRKTLGILVSKKLIDQEKAEKEFNCKITRGENDRQVRYLDFWQ